MDIYKIWMRCWNFEERDSKIFINGYLENMNKALPVLKFQGYGNLSGCGWVNGGSTKGGDNE